MEALAARKKTSEPDLMAIIAGSRKSRVNQITPKIRYRTVRISECLQPKPWEEKFDGMWCNESDY